MTPLVEQAKSKFGSKVPFDSYSLDNRESLKVADTYGVQYVPTLIFLAKDASVANVVVGVADMSVIEQNINKIAD